MGNGGRFTCSDWRKPERRGAGSDGREQGRAPGSCSSLAILGSGRYTLIYVKCVLTIEKGDHEIGRACAEGLDLLARKTSPMKPFPWTCRTCREAAVRPASVLYQTDVEFDGRCYRVELPDLGVLRCESCGAMVLDDEANRKVTEAIARKRGCSLPTRYGKGARRWASPRSSLPPDFRLPKRRSPAGRRGGQVQQRALDQYLRTYFRVPEARRFVDVMSDNYSSPATTIRIHHLRAS